MGLIGSAIGAAGSIFGGISASKAMKKIQRNVEAQRQKNQNWYDRRYNEDYTQRSDAQRILTQTEESIKNRNKQAAGIQAVMGGTDESVAEFFFYMLEPNLFKVLDTAFAVQIYQYTA